MLTEETRRELLAIARAALEARVCRTGTATPDARGAEYPRCGAFVTILHNGDLRGCLGRISSDMPLPSLVHHLAQEVADSDPRFDPVTPGELHDISVEISVLTPEQEIESPEEIEIGRHGLIVERGSHRGLLLPQVPGERGWDRETFLTQSCLKAGLPADAWRHGARIFIFEAEVFGEEESGHG